MRRLLHPRARALTVAVAAAIALALPLAANAATTAAGGPARSGAAASRANSADRIPGYNHVAVIMFTDHGYLGIYHNKHAPTFNRLASKYGLATRVFTTSDPDTAGIMAFLAGNDYGVDDSLPSWNQRVSKPSLLSQLAARHKSWKEYVQDLPYAGYLGDCYPTVCLESDTLYNQPKFNPVPDLTSVASNPAQARNMVPAAELGTDARTGHLPNFSFIDANECANMHGGPPWCIDSPNLLGQHNDNLLVADGDKYLKQVVGEIMSGPQWKHGNNAIIITETEGNTSAGCCDANPGTGRVFTVVITNHEKKHIVDNTKFNDYSMLATVEHAFGLGCLQFACDTKHVIPMGRLFGARKDGAYRFPAKGSDPVRKSTSASVTTAKAKAAVKPAATSPWTVVSSPNTGTNDNDLWSISGRSPTDIWAVGSLLPNANATIVQTLALHYNGTSWSRVRTPDVGPEANSLYGVAALPDGTAWATGIYTQASGYTGRALTMHWNGSKWTTVPAANPGAAEDMLYSVTGVSDSDVWAVGTQGNNAGFFFPLIEHWDGSRWTAVPIVGLPRGTHGILTEVTSSPGAGVWATGQISGNSSDRQVVLHLAGRNWVVVPASPVRTPGAAVADAYPQGIATSPAGVWVAGRDRIGDTGYSTFVEAPDSSGLREVSTPNPTKQDNYLWGIAPVNGGANAWAVGTSFPPSTGNGNSLIEYGSATGGWTVVPSPNPSSNGNNILDGVLAFSSTNVWAVGEFDGNGGMKTLIMHYTGGTM
jgi:Phosphoesterase family